jgi:flagellar basal-body rod protein FlgB
MIEAMFNQPVYLTVKKMLDATAIRHEAISSNIANIETPGYKRIDIAPAFKDELIRASASKSIDQIKNLKPRLEIDQTAVPNTKDGNTVQLEKELIELNQNSVAHAVETQLITASLLKLRLAITGKL